MARRVLAIALIVLLGAMQVRLWVGRDSLAEVHALEAERDRLELEIEVVRERNRVLAADVADLRDGTAALEARARTDLGLIHRDEVLYRFVPESR